MSQYQFEPESRLEGFRGLAEDTQLAMATAPNYWLAWYSAKSILLVGVACAFAYYVGKHSRRSSSLGRCRR